MKFWCKIKPFYGHMQFFGGGTCAFWCLFVSGYVASPFRTALGGVSKCKFWRALEGGSEWLRCKALRLRAQAVYESTWPSPNADSNEADWPFWHTALQMRPDMPCFRIHFGAFPDGTGIQKTLQSPTFSYRILHFPYGKSKENSIQYALSYTFFMYPTPYPTPNPSPEILCKYRASCALV